MSEDELNAAIVRVVKERGAAKKNKAALESELQAAGHALFNIGTILRSVTVDGNATHSPSSVLSQIEKAPDVCQLSRISEMLQDLQKTRERIGELDKNARELGVD